MKTFRLSYSQILIISVFFLSSCSNDSSPTIPDEPSASFRMDKTTARIGEAITFINTSQNATSYEWDFGDGNSSTEENPTHSYSSTGTFTITLTANGEGESISKTTSITIWDSVLELTFYGDSSKFQGPTSFTAGPINFHFYNQSSALASANLVRHDDGYSHQDMLALFEDGFSTSHHPSWTTEVRGVWREIDANDSHTWTAGYLGSGLYTLVSARITPIGAWYGAGLTIE